MDHYEWARVFCLKIDFAVFMVRVCLVCLTGAHWHRVCIGPWSWMFELFVSRLWMAVTWPLGLLHPSLPMQLCSTTFLAIGSFLVTSSAQSVGAVSACWVLSWPRVWDLSATLTWFDPPVEVACQGVAGVACWQLLGATDESWMSGADWKWINDSWRGAQQEVLPRPWHPYTPR